MNAGTDPDVLSSDIYPLGDELRDFTEVVSTEHLVSITFDVLPVEKYLVIKVQATRYPDSNLEEI